MGDCLVSKLVQGWISFKCFENTVKVIASVAFKEGIGNDGGDNSIDDNACRINGCHIRAFFDRKGFFLGLDINGLKRRHLRGEGLHDASENDRVAIGHATFDTTSIVGFSVVALRAVVDGIHCFFSRFVGVLKPQSEFNAFDGLNA